MIHVTYAGYFRFVVSLLVSKVPPVEERGGSCSSPLAESLLGLVLYPLYLATNCRRDHRPEHYQAVVLPSTTWPWVSLVLTIYLCYDKVFVRVTRRLPYCLRRTYIDNV